MHRRIAIVLLVCVQAALMADPPPGYYDPADGKTGADLRAALHAIVRGQHSLPYSGSTHPNTADTLGVLDQDPANTNNLICVYSGNSIARTNIGTGSGEWDRNISGARALALGAGQHGLTFITCARKQRA